MLACSGVFWLDCQLVIMLATRRAGFASRFDPPGENDFRTILGMDSERLPKVHQVDGVPPEPVGSKSLDHRCFPSSWRPADEPSFPKGPARDDLHGESLHKAVVGSGAPRD